jgi:hypothetical protein
MIDLKDITPELHLKIEQYITRRVNSCPACKVNFTEYPFYSCPITINYVDNIDLDAAQLICPNCGYVMLFDLNQPFQKVQSDA